MSLPLPAQSDSKSGFSFQVLKSRAGARFAILGLTVAGVLYYLAAPESYRPELAWPREKPFGVSPPPPPAWDPDFDPPPPPPPPHGGGAPVKAPSDPQMAERAEAVRKAFRHAYNGYMSAAWSYDELLPNTNGSVNNFNGWGVTVVDSISTMQLMGLKSEYDGALDFVAKMDFDINNDGHAPFFETAIRYLGGLVSAHSLARSTVSGPLSSLETANSNSYAGREHVLLAKAALLADKLLPVFDSPSGLPFYGVRTSGPAPVYSTDDPKSYKYSKASDNTPGARIAAGGSAPLAEFASCQMELKYLSWATGQARYFLAAERVMDVMKKAAPHLPLPGLFPIWWERTAGTPVGGGCQLLSRDHALTNFGQTMFLSVQWQTVGLSTC
ncbi:unnamed protein product [Rhizoctonia solani]|uniref:alpha-1,2-Mannosidase n=1 Tax=Rhizoctonia solani TaxID=456999 RepID=A0A8H3E7M4_9AGAM|nr:unnamed protein product [Rhizoctonia solani]